MLASENPGSGEGRNMREKCFFFGLHTFAVRNNLRGN